MLKQVSFTKGAGKLSAISKLSKNLDADFKKHLNERANQNCLFQLLNIVDVEVDMLTTFTDSVIAGNYYDSDRQVFTFDGQTLGVTLEDVLYITGLPILGKPVLFKTAFDDQVLFNVFGKFKNKTAASIRELTDIAEDTEESYERRKIAVLLILLYAFIAPPNSKHEIESVCVQFVKNLAEIDEYAWGAALLAYMYYGIDRYKGGKKRNVEGNLWILLAFFIIRLKEFQKTLGICLENPPESVKNGEPWLKWIINEIKKKSHDHYAKQHIESMLPLSEEDIIWTPYAGVTCPREQDLKSVRDLVPIFCYKVVVYHKPQHCRKQFQEFDDLTPHGCNEKKIKIQKRQGGKLDYFDKYKDELAAWNGRNMRHKNDDRREEGEGPQSPSLDDTHMPNRLVQDFRKTDPEAKKTYLVVLVFADYDHPGSGGYENEDYQGNQVVLSYRFIRESLSNTTDILRTRTSLNERFIHDIFDPVNIGNPCIVTQTLDSVYTRKKLRTLQDTGAIGKSMTKVSGSNQIEKDDGPEERQQSPPTESIELPPRSPSPQRNDGRQQSPPTESIELPPRSPSPQRTEEREHHEREKEQGEELTSDEPGVSDKQEQKKPGVSDKQEQKKRKTRGAVTPLEEYLDPKVRKTRGTRPSRFLSP